MKTSFSLQTTNSTQVINHQAASGTETVHVNNLWQAPSTVQEKSCCIPRHHVHDTMMIIL